MRFEIDNKVTAIKEDEFMSRLDLKSVVIPDSVKNIGDFAFMCCLALKEIEIGAGVQSIGDFAFLGCPGLESIKISEENPYLTCEDGVIYDKDKSELIFIAQKKCPEKFVVPLGVKLIGKGAFYGNLELKELVLPESLTKIGESAFEQCVNLCKVECTNKSLDQIEQDIYCFDDTLISAENN